MLSIPSLSEMSEVQAAYRGMGRCDEGVTSSTSLTVYPTKPINVKNKRFAKKQKKNTQYEKKTVVRSFEMPSSFFNGIGNAPQTVQLELASDGVAVIHWQDDVTLDSDLEKELDAFLKGLDAKELEKYVDALSDIDTFATKNDRSENEKDIDFILRFGGMTKKQIGNVLKCRRLGGFTNGDETRIAFYPTVIDLIRIFKANDAEEIPTVLLEKANEVDDDPKSFILEESVPIGLWLGNRVLNSKHGGVPFTTARKERANIIRNVMGGNVGNPVFVLLCRNNNKGEDGLTIITDEGVLVGVMRDFKNISTAYFVTPFGVVDHVTHAVKSVNMPPFGEPHSRSSIPTALLDKCLLNLIQNRSFLDHEKSDHSNTPNCRRYIEAKD